MLMIASCYSDKALMKRVEDLAHEGEVANVEFMGGLPAEGLGGLRECPHEGEALSGGESEGRR